MTAVGADHEGKSMSSSLADEVNQFRWTRDEIQVNHERISHQLEKLTLGSTARREAAHGQTSGARRSGQNGGANEFTLS